MNPEMFHPVFSTFGCHTAEVMSQKITDVAAQLEKHQQSIIKLYDLVTYLNLIWCRLDCEILWFWLKIYKFIFNIKRHLVANPKEDNAEYPISFRFHRCL